MELNLTVLKHYRVESEKLTDYRSLYTVVELDELGQPTGRSWSEPFNTVSGDMGELAARFHRKISQDNVPPPEAYGELTLFANALANEAKDANKRYITSAVTAVVQEVIRVTIERCERIANQQSVSPEQVILEEHTSKLSERITDILGRAVAQGAREAADQTRHPYETIRESAKAISTAVAELEAAAEHYKLTRWKRLKSVFARDKDATS